MPLLLIAGLVLAGCGGAPAGTDVTASFSAPGGGPAATYDPNLVPQGATAEVTAEESDSSTTVTLSVTGLLPNRAYGAHAHVNPCGADGMAAGPHYQFRQDPVTPSVDPAYANPQNEIWLDFTTNAEGAGEATTTVPWVFPADRRAQAVIIHEKSTSTEAGKAGTAGARPACITVSF
ncbi:MAG: superoxide dismutase family protein [Pseudonocardia sp.]